jgi:AraC family transcriptional regulator of adaptative response/methylated-DNA-[protein]-cysteine methyltransferase
VIVAGTARGICTIELGDSGAVLVDGLRERFPKACLAPAEARFARWLAAVLAYIEHPHGLLDLPLDVQGTVFQRQVWETLRAIPSGTTMSYAELAKAIGRPGAARAVARACASNPVAVAVPCHRIVRGDGLPAGYRWGVARKAELLRRESE